MSSFAAMLGLIFFPMAMIYAGLMDLVTLKIRNHVVLAIGIAWLVLAPLSGIGFAELGASAAVAGIVLVVTFTFFALGWIGGGDAKLAAVSALWFSPDQTLLYFIYAAVLGGFLTLLILQLRSRMLPQVVSRVPWLVHLQDAKAGVPYGAAMAPAALIVFPQTVWVAQAAF